MYALTYACTFPALQVNLAFNVTLTNSLFNNVCVLAHTISYVVVCVATIVAQACVYIYYAPFICMVACATTYATLVVVQA